MQFSDISVPPVYKESNDFRFFLKWFELALSRIKFDTENIFDLYDPLKCPDHLLWMLGDTMGYRFDDRLPTSFNRLVLLYFMSMIRHKGSKDGVTLAAETNLAQFEILEQGKEKDILYNRLENTSVPVNSVYVTPHTKEGYIDIVYFSSEVPVDACIEYVRPLGMYTFQHAGVRFDARTKVSVDARLTNENEIGMSIGSTHVGHYRRDDYARMQRGRFDRIESEVYQGTTQTPDYSDTRNPVYYRNSDFEEHPNLEHNPGYRALYSLQLCNNEHVVKSLLGDEIFSLGYGPQDVTTVYPDDYLRPPYKDKPVRNLRYDRDLEESISKDVYTVDSDRTDDIVNPRPAVNPVMSQLGDAISMNTQNTKYTKVDENGEIHVEDV